MRFPLRLTAKLAKARTARVWRAGQTIPFIEFADPAEVLHLGSAHPVSHERMRAIISSPAPVVWIGGAEPLDHPGIGHFVRANALGGRFVFLETGGALLRRRIHEFQPLPRVFLTLRLGLPGAPAFERAVEGIHAARLSGFFTAVHSVVHEGLDLGELRRFREFLSEWHVDGWLITAAAANDVAARKAHEARTLIPNAQWRRFSGHVEHLLLSKALCKNPQEDHPTAKPLSEMFPEDEDVKVA